MNENPRLDDEELDKTQPLPLGDPELDRIIETVKSRDDAQAQFEQRVIGDALKGQTLHRNGEAYTFDRFRPAHTRIVLRPEKGAGELEITLGELKGFDEFN